MELSKNKLRKILQEEKLFFDFIEVEYVVNDFDLHFRCFEGEILSYFDWNYIMVAVQKLMKLGFHISLNHKFIMVGEKTKKHNQENIKTELLKLIVKTIKELKKTKL